MTSVLRKLKPLIIQPIEKHTSSIIILHGSGDTGEGLCQWMKEIDDASIHFSNSRLIFPSAPSRPYSASMGNLQTVWFDRGQISPFAEEHEESIQESCSDLRELVDIEVKNGIPYSHMIVGGFSMGGSLALYYGMRCGLPLAGIFSLSSFLNTNSMVYQDFEENPGQRPPLFQAHGQRDPLVRHEWGMHTHQALISRGVSGTFHTFPNLVHEMNSRELELLRVWINDCLPDVKTQ